MTDKKPKAIEQPIPNKPSEPPILWDVIDDDEAEAAQEHGADNAQSKAEQLPQFSDEYDLSLVDEERELRRQARRW